MLVTSCTSCRSEFAVAPHHAGRTVACPRCASQVQVAAVLDLRDDAGMPPGEPRPQIDVFARPATTGVRRAAARSGPSGLVLLGGVLLALAGAATVVWWSLPDAAPEGGAPVRPTSGGGIALDGSDVEDAAARLAAKPASPPPLPALPAGTGLELCGPAMLTHARLSGMAWTGSACIATLRGGCAVAWPLRATAQAGYAIEAVLTMQAASGGACSLALDLPHVDTPIAVRLSWPGDGRARRLRCWVAADGAVRAAVDDAEVEVVRTEPPADAALRGGLGVSCVAAWAKLGALRVLGGTAWQGLPQQAVPVRAAEAPAFPVFRPFSCPLRPEPLAIMASDAGVRERAAGACAALVCGVRPETQAELDLAARLLWLGACLAPDDARLAAVAKALAETDRSAALTAVPDLPSPTGDALDALVAPVPGYDLLREHLVAWMRPGSPALRAGADALDWAFLLRLARDGGQGGAAVRDMAWRPHLLRRTDTRWTCLDAAGAGGAFTVGSAPQPVLQAVINARPVPLPGCGLQRLRVARGVAWADGDALVDPEWSLQDGDDALISLVGVGRVDLAAGADPATILASCEVHVPDLAVLPDRPDGIAEPALVLGNLVEGPLRAAWRPWQRRPQGRAELPSPDTQRAVAIPTLHLRVRDGTVGWRLSTRDEILHEGRCAFAGAVLLQLRPDAGAGMSILRSELRRGPSLPSRNPLDSLLPHQSVAVAVGPPPIAAPSPPRIAALSHHVLTVGRDNAFEIVLDRAVPSGETLWAFDFAELKLTPPQRWIVYRSGLATGEPGRAIEHAIKPQPEMVAGYLFPGFALPLSPVGSGSVRAVATPGQLGPFKVVLGSTIAAYRSSAPERMPGVHVVVAPARPGWDAAAWCAGLIDRNRDGVVDGLDYGLGEVLLAQAGELQFEDPLSPSGKRHAPPPASQP